MLPTFQFFFTGMETLSGQGPCLVHLRLPQNACHVPAFREMGRNLIRAYLGLVVTLPGWSCSFRLQLSTYPVSPLHSEPGLPRLLLLILLGALEHSLPQGKALLSFLRALDVTVFPF